MELKKKVIDSMHRREFYRIWFRGYSAFQKLITWSVVLANAVLPHLQLFTVRLAWVSVCCILHFNLNREHKASKDKLECHSGCLILRLQLWRNQFNSGDCYSSLTILSRIGDIFSNIPLSSVYCEELEYHLFIIMEGVALLFGVFLVLYVKKPELPLRFIVMAP